MASVDLPGISALLRESNQPVGAQPRRDSRRSAAPVTEVAPPPSVEPKVPDLLDRSPVPEPNTDALGEIEELLGLNEDAGAGDGDGGDHGDPRGDGVNDGSLKALAEKLGVDPADLYAVKVPMGGDAEPLTLGELKDIAKGAADLTVDRLRFDEEVTAHRKQTTKDRSDLQALVAMLPREALSPAMVKAARDAGEAYTKEQGRLLGELVPEWSDEGAFTRDRDMIVKHVKAAGWTEQDLNGVQDARLLAYFRQQARRESRMVELLGRMKSAGSLSKGFKANPKARAAVEAERIRGAARSGSRADKVGAIESLLKGK